MIHGTNPGKTGKRKTVTTNAKTIPQTEPEQLELVKIAGDWDLLEQTWLRRRQEP